MFSESIVVASIWRPKVATKRGEGVKGEEEGGGGGSYCLLG